MSTVRTLTLADVAVPRSNAFRDALLIAAGTVLTAFAAQLEIRTPWSVVPITGQTFAVLLTGAVLGGRRGLLCQLLYLAEGAAGLPVFAGGASGALVFAGPTAGYLAAFPLAAFVTGSLAERGWDRHFATMFASMLLGSVAIFALGLGGLARFVPANALLAQGLLPFVPGDLIKSGLAALAFPVAWKWLGSREQH